MEKKLITGGVLASLVLATGLAGAVSAQTAAEATGLTEEEAIAIALDEVPGEVQEAEFEEERGMAVFEIEILAEDGTEMEVEIDAMTGEILEVEAENDHDDDCDDDDHDDDHGDDEDEDDA